MSVFGSIIALPVIFGFIVRFDCYGTDECCIAL